MGITEFAHGDVVYLSDGPFSGACGVVWGVDAVRSELRLELVVREPGGGRHRQTVGMTVGFHEVEWP
ncbi:hypothetical protein [Nocardia sp. IFM 10818]